MRLPATQYLMWRAVDAPAVVVALAIQGVFRGFKDTKTPLYATSKLTLYCVRFYFSVAFQSPKDVLDNSLMRLLMLEVVQWQETLSTLF